MHWGIARVPDHERYVPFDVIGAMTPAMRAADVLVLPEAWRWHDARGSFVDQLANLGFAHTVETRFVTLDVSGHRRTVAHPGEGWWGLAVASRHPIVSSSEVPLARSVGDPVPRRHAIACVIDADGAHVDLVAFHVSSKLWWAAPLVQLASLRRAMAAASIDGTQRPALLVGDANLWRTALPAALPHWRSTVRGATFPSWRAHSQIDHVLTRGAVEMVGGAVQPYSPTSDHRAIVAELALT